MFVGTHGTRLGHPDADSGTSAAGPSTAKRGMLGRIDLGLQARPVTAVPVGVIRKFSDERAGRHAAILAYYGFFSLFPALLAMTTILGFVLQGHDALRADIADSAFANFPVVGDTISNTVSGGLRGSTIALVIGLIAALWAGMGMAEAAQDAMNDLWGVTRAAQPGALRKRLRSLFVLVVIAGAIVASTAVGQLAVVLTTGVLGAIALAVASCLVNVLVFMAAFRLLTVHDVAWRTVLPGAVFSGAAYTALQLLGGLYVTRTINGASETYGTFAIVIGLLSWIFLIAQVTILGAELNVVLDRRLWPRSLFAARPDRGNDDG